jgi:polysaccharide pyruvyl transferase WcaK-like protein
VVKYAWRRQGTSQLRNAMLVPPPAGRVSRSRAGIQAYDEARHYQPVIRRMTGLIGRLSNRCSTDSMPGTERKLVGLFGAFGIGNFGNDGSLEAALLLLRRIAPEERLLCICGNPADVEKAFGLDAISIYHRPRRSAEGRAAVLIEKVVGRATLWFHAMRHLRRLRVLVIPGTGLLDDFSVSPIGWPYDLLSWFVLARLMGVKVVLASIGAGPIRHPVSRWLMRSAARAAHYRSYRDLPSKAFMESIGLDTRHDVVYPDIAFNLPAPRSAPRRNGGDGSLTIGVGVMAYHGWRNDPVRGAEIYAAYLDKITTFVLWLLQRGHVVRILMGEVSDRRAVDDLFQALRTRKPDLADGSVMFAPAHTLTDVMQQMADLDLVVATRYHNVVCALRMSKPTISIGYAVKNDALLGEMGLAAFCQHIEDFDVGRLEAQITQLMSDRGAFERRIREAGKQFECKLRDQESRLASLIHSPSC